MNTGWSQTSFGALDRLASRAAGIVAPDAMLPRIPSMFEVSADVPRPTDVSGDDATPVSRAAPNVHDPVAPSPTPASRGVSDARADARPTTAIATVRGPAHDSDPQRTRQIIHHGSPEVSPAPRTPAAASSTFERSVSHVTSRVVEVHHDATSEHPPTVAAPDLRGRATSHVPSVQTSDRVHNVIARAPFIPHTVATVQPRVRQAERPLPLEARERSVVHVTIGRVEIRATSPAVSVASKPSSDRAMRHESGLDAYLRRRAVGSRS